MAEAFANKMGLRASSAGTIPSSQVNPLVVKAMGELGLDVSAIRPKRLTENMIEEADIVVLTDSSIEGSIPMNLRKKNEKQIRSVINI